MPNTASADTSLRKNLRQSLRQKRQGLSKQAQLRAAQKLALRIKALPEFKQAQSAAFYLASDGEICPRLIIENFLMQQKSCYLPVICNKRNSREMIFHRYKKGGLLKANRFGIYEPLYSQDKKQAHELDLVFMPLVGFDRQGNRLGMGGGYYDRALAKQPKRFKQKLRYIGLAHHIQEVDKIDSQRWDIPMHAIITDRDTIILKR